MATTINITVKTSNEINTLARNFFETGLHNLVLFFFAFFLALIHKVSNAIIKNKVIVTITKISTNATGSIDVPPNPLP